MIRNDRIITLINAHFHPIRFGFIQYFAVFPVFSFSLFPFLVLPRSCFTSINLCLFPLIVLIQYIPVLPIIHVHTCPIRVLHVHFDSICNFLFFFPSCLSIRLISDWLQVVRLMWFQRSRLSMLQTRRKASFSFDEESKDQIFVRFCGLEIRTRRFYDSFVSPFVLAFIISFILIPFHLLSF